MTMARIPGLVWCDHHGVVHEDSTEPFGPGHWDECPASAHRPVYAALRYREARSDFPPAPAYDRTPA